MITFNSFVLFGFLLRVLFVGIGAFLSIKVIGFKNIQFLKEYVRKRAFGAHKLFYWIVAFLSIVYFEHLVSHAHSVTFSEVYTKNWFLSMLVMLLLFGVVTYAFLEAKNSIKVAKDTKTELESAKNWKTVFNVINIGSFFVPGGLMVKFAVFGISFGANMYVNNQIEKTLSKKIIETIEIMLIIVVVNLSIILISTYLITDQIIFW